jgi:hypothetical protein
VSHIPGWNAQEKRRPGAWPVLPSLLLPLLILLGSCTSVSTQGKRDAPLSDLLLQLDSTEKMGGDPSCHDRRISTTEVLGAVDQSTQGVSSRWTERWTVDRCGTLVPYLVKFARDASGDLDVTMQLEALPRDAANVPGATLADPTLQRDVLGFLAQRDFPEAWADGRCDARKVTNTEIVQPLEGAVVEQGRPVAGQWVERWTLFREFYRGPARTEETLAAQRLKTPEPAVDRCGVPVRYIVRFTTTPKGTTFTVENER